MQKSDFTHMYSPWSSTMCKQLFMSPSPCGVSLTCFIQLSTQSSLVCLAIISLSSDAEVRCSLILFLQLSPPPCTALPQKGMWISYSDIILTFAVTMHGTFNLTSICKCSLGDSHWVVTVPGGCLKEDCYNKKQRLKPVFICVH